MKVQITIIKSLYKETHSEVSNQLQVHLWLSLLLLDMLSLRSLLPFVLCAVQVASIPTPSSSGSAQPPWATVPFAGTEPNEPLWGPDSSPSVVAPIRGSLGAPIMGPDNVPIDLENPDLFAPPTTDKGFVYVVFSPFLLLLS